MSHQNGSQPIDEVTQTLLDKFNNLRNHSPNSVENNAKEWKELCEEFNKIQTSITNKIPKSEFEARYSIFYNKENVDKFSSRSATAELWRDRSEEFLKRIDPYRPFYVVDDNDHDRILKTFPPIFRQVNTINDPFTSGDQEYKNKFTDEFGQPVGSEFLANVVNNVFDRYSTHQLASKRQEGAILLRNCMLQVQNKETLIEDVKATDVLFKYFNTNINHNNSDDDTGSSHIEDMGISFD